MHQYRDRDVAGAGVLEPALKHADVLDFPSTTLPPAAA